VQEKFCRRIQLQQGRKQHDAFCPPASISLSMDLSDVMLFVEATAVRQPMLVTWKPSLDVSNFLLEI